MVVILKFESKWGQREVKIRVKEKITTGIT